VFLKRLPTYGSRLSGREKERFAGVSKSGGDSYETHGNFPCLGRRYDQPEKIVWSEAWFMHENLVEPSKPRKVCRLNRCSTVDVSVQEIISERMLF